MKGCSNIFETIPKLPTLERAVKIELEHAHGQEEQFLRSSTGLCAILKEISREYGQSYFRFLLWNILGDQERLRSIQHNREELILLATDLIHRIECSLDSAPFVLRLCCQYVLQQFNAKFPHSERGKTIVVGGLVILRVICPALVKPELFGFQPHTAKTLQSGVLIAKLVQHAMRGTTFDPQYDQMSYANEFIHDTKHLLEHFLHDFPTASPPANYRQHSVDLSSHRSSLSTQYSSPRMHPARSTGSYPPKKKFSWRSLWSKKTVSTSW